MENYSIGTYIPNTLFLIPVHAEYSIYGNTTESHNYAPPRQISPLYFQPLVSAYIYVQVQCVGFVSCQKLLTYKSPSFSIKCTTWCEHSSYSQHTSYLICLTLSLFSSFGHQTARESASLVNQTPAFHSDGCTCTMSPAYTCRKRVQGLWPLSHVTYRNKPFRLL